jgi:hypothetical protein
VTDVEAIRDSIARYGRDVRAFFHADQRATLISPLFNVPGRLVVGSHCYLDHAAWVLRRTLERTGPEELGRRMRGLCRRPNYVSLNALMLGYLNGREQRRLLGGLAPDEPLAEESLDDTAVVVDAWRRIGGAYVEAGALLPAERGGPLRVLGPEEAEQVAALARPADQDARRRVSRAMAIIEVYTFILNGEARVGVFNHGPYELSGGEDLVVKELVGLDERSLPWDLPVRPSLANLARVMRVRGVSARVDLFGSLVTEPFEYADRIVGEAVVTVEDGAWRPVSAPELEAAAVAAGTAQLAMYEQAVGWSSERQVGYGADLYASLIAPFPRLAGLGLDAEIRERFAATAARVVPGLCSGEEPPLVLGRLGASDGELYSPVLPAA